MEGKTTGVTRRQDICSLTPVVEAAGLYELFEEQTDQVLRVRAGASSAVVVINGVSHVRLVVCAVEVDTIPAHGEENLVADTVNTLVRVGEVDILALGICGVVGNSTAVVCT